MRIPSPEQFLEVIAPQQPGGRPVAVRFAKVDPAYSSGQPKLVFEGETTLTTRTFPRLGSYTPAANDRVIVLNGVVLGKFS